MLSIFCAGSSERSRPECNRVFPPERRGLIAGLESDRHSQHLSAHSHPVAAVSLHQSVPQGWEVCHSAVERYSGTILHTFLSFSCLL